MLKKLIFVAFLFSSLLFATSEDVMRANINYAGKLNTSVQKCMKHVVLIAEGFDKKSNIKGLKQTTKNFDKVIKIFIDGGKNKFGIEQIENSAIRTNLKGTMKLWEDFKKKISKKSFDANALEEIDHLHDTLLEKTDRFIHILTDDCKGLTKVKIDTATDMYEATKQRTRSERMATLVALIYKKVNLETNQKRLKETVAKYERVINGLINGDDELGIHKIKINDIKKQLISEKRYWDEVKTSINRDSFTKEEVTDVVQKCIKLREDMAKGVKLYERSAKRQRKHLALSNLVNNIMAVGSKKEHVINLSIKEAARSQKMAKHVLLIAMGVNLPKNNEALKISAYGFDKTLKGFINGDKELDLSATTHPPIIKKLKILKKSWKPFFKNVNLILKDNGDKKAIKYIIENNDNLLDECQNLVKMFEKDRHFSHNIEDSSTAQIKFSGKLRMYSQRMAKEKLMIIGGMQVDKHNKNLLKCITNFDQIVHGLLESDKKLNLVGTSDKKIRTQLGKVQKMWLTLEPLYQKKKLSDKDLKTILKLNDPLRLEIDKAVTLFEHSVDN